VQGTGRLVKILWIGYGNRHGIIKVKSFLYRDNDVNQLVFQCLLKKGSNSTTTLSLLCQSTVCCPGIDHIAFSCHLISLLLFQLSQHSA
jgi:hypothetical protein